MKEANPFLFGRIVYEKTFCPRREQTEELRNYVSAGQSVVVLGERRVGKTSLVTEAVRGMKGYGLVDCDFWAVKSLQDVAERIMSAIVTMQAKDRTLWEKMRKTVSSLRPALAVDTMTGTPTVSITPAKELRPESFDGVFDLIAEIAKEKPVAVAFDEFQDVKDIKGAEALLGRMRGRIQRQKGVAYIFTGSIRHGMDAIFRDAKSPFFKSVNFIEVGPLPPSEFFRYLGNRFRRGKRKFPKASFETIRELALDNPNDIQQLCSAVWHATSEGETVSEPVIEEALQRLLAAEKKNCEVQYKLVTGLQQRVLKALARHGGKHPQSKFFLREAKVSLPASVKGALNRLVKLEFIYGPETEYKFFDPWFRQWLIRRAP